MLTTIKPQDDGGLLVEVDGDVLTYDFDSEQVAQIRTAVEAPWAAAERALDEAVADGKIARWVPWHPWYGNCNRWEYGIQVTKDSSFASLYGATREAAAAAAVAFLATFPAPKPALPDPRDMTHEAIVRELARLGWHWETSGWCNSGSMNRPTDYHEHINPAMCENGVDLAVRVLRRARILARAAGVVSHV